MYMKLIKFYSDVDYFLAQEGQSCQAECEENGYFCDLGKVLLL